MTDWRYELVVAADRAELSQRAVERFVESARIAVDDHGFFFVALSGGSTPRDLHTLLASPAWRDRVDWERTHVFWGDERGVPPDDPRSNYRMARETLLDHVPIPAQNVHRPRAEVAEPETAAEYAAQIARVVRPDAGGVPWFDLILLGLGDDGHTASLLPGDPLVHEREGLVAWTTREREGTRRVTFTPPLLQAARELIFLVAGADKAPVLREVLHGDEQLERYPAQVVRRARGGVAFLVDRAAAAELPSHESGR